MHHGRAEAVTSQSHHDGQVTPAAALHEELKITQALFVAGRRFDGGEDGIGELPLFVGNAFYVSFLLMRVGSDFDAAAGWQTRCVQLQTVPLTFVDRAVERLAMP